ncbi:hypothetical protein PL329_16635 [Escherichia coli]|uniref:hypothetical protein n=1 Tax=Escherichia coli TaxID=562 RepID=UPI0023074D4D|nr:hypothetical protein [Escherichia coli]WCE52621.1 hypothetical protein PL329_16635 [Escherichia coli]
MGVFGGAPMVDGVLVGLCVGKFGVKGKGAGIEGDISFECGGVGGIWGDSGELYEEGDGEGGFSFGV